MNTGTQIALRAKDHLTLLTGRKPEAVSGLAKEDDGWHVTLDTLELKRIPASTDIMAAYELVLDDEGNLVSYGRTRRYSRGQPEEEAVV